MIYNADVLFYKGACSETSHVPNRFVVMNGLHFLMLLYVNFAFEESATTAKNRVVLDVTEVVSQIIDTVQSTVAIPAGEVRDHLAGERVAEARNTWLAVRTRKDRSESSIRTRVIDPVEIPTFVENEPPATRWCRTGWFGTRWFGCGRSDRSPPSEYVCESVKHRGGPRWSRPGSSLSHAIGDSFPLPFTSVQKHRFVP